MAVDSASPQSASVGKRKRRRLALSCFECRRRKMRCDRKKPCTNCVQGDKACEYHGEQEPLHRQIPTTGLGVIDIKTWSEQNANEKETPTSGIEQSATTESQRSITSESVASRPELNGRFVKARLFGESHWMNNTIEFPNLVAWRELFYNEHGEINPLLAQCKQVARQLKGNALARTPRYTNLRDHLPSKDICDNLIQAYLDMFEPVFRIFHLPTFRSEYADFWAAPTRANDIYSAKLLLLAAIGACLYEDQTYAQQGLQAQSVDWVYAVQTWLKLPLAKQCINLGGVQIHCLLILALQTTAVGGDHSWIAAGSLVRTAMTIGLHRDPAHYPKMSFLEAETRRRLWATTLELATQTSLDAGMPPLINWKDFDCAWPSNIDDNDFDEQTLEPCESKALSIFTQNSIQCALTRSLQTRLQIATLLNNLRSEISYEEVIQLGTDLTTVCRENLKLFSPWVREAGPVGSKISFQVKVLDVISRRFLLSLHLPFAKRALANDMTFYFSRKVCIDSAMSILTYQPASTTGLATGGEEYARLRVHGRGMFRAFQIQAAAQTIMELVATLRDDAAAPTSPLSCNGLYQAIVETTEIAKRRVEAGETNVKMYVCLACALDQIHTLEQGGVSAAQALERARKTSLEWCLGILSERLSRQNSLTSWDPTPVMFDWSGFLAPEWGNEGWFFDD